MKNTLKTKLSFLILGAGLLLGACGTSNNVVNNGIFTKRKYTDGYNVNFKKDFKSEDTKKESETILVTEAQVEEKVASKLTKTNTVVNSISSKESISQENKSIATTKTEEIELLTKEAEKTNDQTVRSKENNSIIGNLKDAKNASKVLSMKRMMKKSAPQPKKDSGFIRLLLMIILAIALIALIQMLFAGTLIGNVISLVLLILLVLFILRIFGVI